jgi:formimidoylglutamate deiminase
LNRVWLWAPYAWIEHAWQEGVLLEVGSDGRFARISHGLSCPPDAHRLAGPVLPAMVNAHSHAFQRGFAGLTEQRHAQQDDFWSWRERMYELALRITPDQVRVIATQLYAELLAGGYTQVCEFHYLHHAPDGTPYAQPAAMCEALAQAASDVGIGLTLLPVLYQRSGFGQTTLTTRQRRFAGTPQSVLALRDASRRLGYRHLTAGVAIHSLRAVAPQSIAHLITLLGDDPAPVHIHIAEQTAEVQDCLTHTGLRPIRWLAEHVRLDHRWQLVHATHADAADVQSIAGTGAGIVVCPSTEANLGDGLFDWRAWRSADVPTAIGSDSHVSRQWPGELRLLEYGQRLHLRQRNIAAHSYRGMASSGNALFASSLTAGATASGHSVWGLREGARADLLVLDTHASGLLGVPAPDLIDALIFACDAPAFDEVWVAGERRVAAGRHLAQAQISVPFSVLMQSLTAQAAS